MNDTMLHVAARVACTGAEGPWERFAVWVQGCSIRCPGCCNPEMFAPRGGEALDVATLVAEVRRARDRDGIEGLTVLGGEPFDQPRGLAALCRDVRALGLGVIVFSGYRRDELELRPWFAEAWATLDTLVDGRFEADRPEPTEGRRPLGSSNQGLHHRTTRYADLALWHGAPTVEARVDDRGRIVLHGAPGGVAALRSALGRHRRVP